MPQVSEIIEAVLVGVLAGISIMLTGALVGMVDCSGGRTDWCREVQTLCDEPAVEVWTSREYELCEITLNHHTQAGCADGYTLLMERAR